MNALTIEVSILCVFLLLNNWKLEWDKAGFRNRLCPSECMHARMGD